MTIAIATASVARITPAENTTGARMSAANHAVDALANTLANAARLGEDHLSGIYGASTDTVKVATAVRLALAVAKSLSSPEELKARGEARQNILAVTAILGESTPTDHALVAAARVRLDSLAEDKRVKRAEKVALADKLNDKSKSLKQRADALAQMVAIESEENDAKSASATARFESAARNMLATGFSLNQMVTILEELAK